MDWEQSRGKVKSTMRFLSLTSGDAHRYLCWSVTSDFLTVYILSRKICHTIINGVALTLIYNILEWKITEIRVTVWLKSPCPREENQIAIPWCVLSPNRPASLTLHCVVYLSASRENDRTTRTMIRLQRSTLARRNSPGVFYFFFRGGTPAWNEKGNLEKPKLMFLSPKKANLS